MVSMVVLVGTMPSMASLVSLGSAGVTGTSSSESSYSLVRRVSLSKRNFGGTKKWLCRYSLTTTTTTDFIAEQGNGASLDSNTLRSKVSSDDAEIVLKPAPRPVLKSSETILGINSVPWDKSGIGGQSSDGERSDAEEERNKVIESLGEVLEKAEKLETSRPVRKENDNVGKQTRSNMSGDKVNAAATRKTKTLKSVWRKGDTVASVQKTVSESPKVNNGAVKEEPKVGGDVKVGSQPFRPPQPPLRPQPKLQGKPSVAPPPAIKKPVLKDVGAVSKSLVTDESDSDTKTKERKPILIDKFASKKPVVDPLIAQAVLAPTKPGKNPTPGKFKDDYRKKNISAGGPRRRIINDEDIEIPDEETSELNVKIPGAATARKGRKWSKASRKAARLQAAKDAAPVKVEILEVEENGMLIEELAYNLAISEGEILGYLYSKGIKPDGVQTLDKDIVKMVCKEYDVEVLEVDPVRVEEMAKKKEILDDEDLDKLEDRPPVLTIMGHVDHGKVGIHVLQILFELNVLYCFILIPTKS